MENWKDILNFKGYYQVSDKLRVRSLDRYVAGKNNTTRLIKGKVLVPQINANGYIWFGLVKEGKRGNSWNHLKF